MRMENDQSRPSSSVIPYKFNSTKTPGIKLEKKAHHEKAAICTSRAKYRQGKKDTAVKVYTVSQESYYILIQNVPSIDIAEELQNLCQTFGKVELFLRVPDYPREDFTEVYLVKYQKLQEARVSKKQLDERSFFGDSLHVCFAPECESVEETRAKLNERKRIVNARLNILKNPGLAFQKAKDSNLKHVTTSNMENVSSTSDSVIATTGINIPDTDIDKGHLVNTASKDKAMVDQNYTYIWAGKEYSVTSEAAMSHLSSSKSKTVTKTKGRNFVPRQILYHSRLDTTDPSLQTTRKRIADTLDRVNVSNPEVNIKIRKKL